MFSKYLIEFSQQSIWRNKSNFGVTFYISSLEIYLPTLFFICQIFGKFFFQNIFYIIQVFKVICIKLTEKNPKPQVFFKFPLFLWNIP